MWIGLAAWKNVRTENETQIVVQEIEYTDINKLLEVIVKVGQVILSSLVIRDEFLLSLEELLSLLLERFTLSSLMVNARHHQSILIIVLVLRMLCKEFLNGDQR